MSRCSAAKLANKPRQGGLSVAPLDMAKAWIPAAKAAILTRSCRLSVGNPENQQQLPLYPSKQTTLEA
jgi:hypothetical protein